MLGAVGHLSRKVLKRMGLLWDLGLGWVIHGGFKERGLCSRLVYWQEVDIILWLGILINFIHREKRLDWADLGEIGKEAAASHIRVGNLGHFCGLVSIPVCSAFCCLAPLWYQRSLVWYWCSVQLSIFSRRTPTPSQQISSEQHGGQADVSTSLWMLGQFLFSFSEGSFHCLCLDKPYWSFTSRSQLKPHFLMIIFPHPSPPPRPCPQQNK